MSQPEPIIDCEVVQLSEDEKLFTEIGRDIHKKHNAFLIESAHRLVTLSVSLLGGSILFLRDGVLPPAAYGWSVVLFMAALVASFIASIPMQGSFHLDCPGRIESEYRRVTHSRNQFVNAAAVAMFFGLLVASLGVLFGSNNPPIPHIP